MNVPALGQSLLIRLLAPYFIALLGVATALYVYGNAIVEQLYVTTLSKHVLQQAQLVGKLLPWKSELDAEAKAIGGDLGIRITVIAGDGTVIGDSSVAANTLENHRDRPEVRAALRDGDGESLRTSATVHSLLFYRAWRQARDGERRVIRIAVPVETITSARGHIRWAIFGGFLIAAVAAFWPALILSRRLSARITRLATFSDSVARGEDPPPLAPRGEGVIATLEANLSAMAHGLRSQLFMAKEEASKLEAVLAGMVEGVLVLDHNGNVRLANRRAGEFLGTPADELRGRRLIEIVRDPDLLELVRDATRQEHPEPIAREIVLQRPRPEYLSVTAAPIAPRPGTPRLFTLVFHDISEMKRVEAMRRDFVANVSHELRTPLTAIRGYTETLQNGAVNNPELAVKFLGIIERHCERLSRLVDDLLTLSDLELGRAALQKSAFALADVVNAAVEVLRSKAEKAQITIDQALPADLPLLYADADRIEQILVNLIDNSVKYTRAGGAITVSATVTGSADNAVAEPWMEIAVSDTGIGVPKQDLPRLTERFYRVDKARSRELGGTGLGLAIVKHIIQAHGGHLRIESQPERGTTVFIELPLNVPGERPASWKAAAT